MLNFQIQEMKVTIKRLLAKRRPPLYVFIQIDQARHLGVYFIEDVRTPFEHREPCGKLTPKLVPVLLSDLAIALQGAKGVESQISW